MRHALIPAFAAAILAVPHAAGQAPQTARDSARHALDRLGYGPTPGLVDEVVRVGVTSWIDQQLSGTAPDPGARQRDARANVLAAPTDALVRMHTDRVRAASQSARDSGMQRPAAQIMAPGAGSLRRHNSELAALTLVRAVEARDQLGEVLADFWLNHFNVFINKGLDRAYFRDYLETTIRPNVRGTFGQLLAATASSPAMLLYLDNVQSAAEMPTSRARQPMVRGSSRGTLARARDAMAPAVPPTRTRRGINENYARELLELHTIGVDGGYTQADVTDVARIFTGWSIARGSGGNGFQFNARMHDRDAKTVLGTRFPSGGDMREGQRLLDMLAMHPATMRHVSTKLCKRFVADDPPAECIDIAVQAWRQADGSIPAILAAILHSDTFWSSAGNGTKVKSPLEFLVSAVRVIGGAPDMTPRLAQQLTRLGQPLFQHVAPNGYPETQGDWVNSGALLARMNFGIAVAANRVPGVQVNLDGVVPATADHDMLVARVDRAILDGRMTQRTRTAIVAALADITDPVAARARAVGMAIGGPEFQQQ